MPTQKNDKNWIQKAEEKMKREGTQGVFTEKAKRHGKSVASYASEVIKELKGNTRGNKTKLKLLRQAIFAKTMQKIGKKKK